MISGICGDFIGSKWEFNKEKIPLNFKLIDLDKQNITDETIFFIAMMDCINNQSNNYKKYLIKWCKKYPNRGYGSRFTSWLYSYDQKDYQSKGNGCLTRIAPIAYKFKGTTEELDSEVIKAINFTHGTEEGIKWAKAIARTIYMAKRNIEPVKILKNIEKEVLTNEKFCDIIDLKGYRSELAKDAAPYCIIAGLMNESFENGIREVIYRGIDADSLAAITGCILEARGIYPKQDIIETIFKQLPEEMKEVIKKFYKE